MLKVLWCIPQVKSSLNDPMISSSLITQALIFTRNKDNATGPQAGLLFYEEVWRDGAALTKRQMCSLSMLPYVNPSFEWKSGILILDVWLKSTRVNQFVCGKVYRHTQRVSVQKNIQIRIQLFVILAWTHPLQVVFTHSVFACVQFLWHIRGEILSYKLAIIWCVQGFRFYADKIFAPCFLTAKHEWHEIGKPIRRSLTPSYCDTVIQTSRIIR